MKTKISDENLTRCFGGSDIVIITHRSPPPPPLTSFDLIVGGAILSLLLIPGMLMIYFGIKKGRKNGFFK